MKKSVVIAGLALVAGLVAVIGLVVAIGVWYYWPALSPSSSHRTAPLRAMMTDEDAPRPAEPSLALQVNEALDATVLAGTPLWFQLNVTNASAMNDGAGTRFSARRSRARRRPGTGRPRPSCRGLRRRFVDGRRARRSRSATHRIRGRRPCNSS
jgi:hypothetical protein